MKNADKLLVGLIEAKIDQVTKINVELLPLVLDADKLSELNKKTMKRLCKKQAEIFPAISAILKMLK